MHVMINDRYQNIYMATGGMGGVGHMGDKNISYLTLWVDGGNGECIYTIRAQGEGRMFGVAVAVFALAVEHVEADVL